MSRRASILVLLSLAIGMFYGLYAVPSLLHLVPAEQETGEWHSDIEQELSERLAQQEAAAQVEATRVAHEHALAELEAKLAAQQRAIDSLLWRLDKRTRLVELEPQKNTPLPPLSIVRSDGKGTVTAIDSSGDLVTIRIGPGDRLQRGAAVDIYRPGAERQYVGVLLITEVRICAAVGRMMPPYQPVQIGDEVSGPSKGLDFSR